MVEDAADFRTKSEDIKDAVEEKDIPTVAEADLAMAMEEEEIIGAVDKIIEWCDAMTNHIWRFIHNMTSLTMNGTGYLRHK